jgi:hypothetical protein
MNTRLAMVTALLVLGCFATWIIGAMLEPALDPFPDRVEPGLHKQVSDWKEGQVGYCDYSSYPGTSNWKLEWHGASKERRILVEVGDETPQHYELLADGSLTVINSAGRFLRFESPHALPNQ